MLMPPLRNSGYATVHQPTIEINNSLPSAARTAEEFSLAAKKTCTNDSLRFASIYSDPVFKVDFNMTSDFGIDILR